MAGRFETFELPGPLQRVPRRVTVWLPPGHGQGPRHPVLYMHDGQNLFDPADAFGGQAWDVVPTLLALARQRPDWPLPIIVGIWNTPQRRQDYGPAAPLQRLPAAWRDEVYGGPALSDAYLQFLVEVLKPHVDARWHSRPEAASTWLMGASMGGLVSLYALVQQPQVFGAAACLSTHWPMSTQAGWITAPGDPRAVQAQQALRDWLAERLPPPGTHRLYFDHGTTGLDALYPPLQAEVDAVLARRGWVPGRHFISRQFDGADHNEAAWRARLHLPLGALLGWSPA